MTKILRVAAAATVATLALTACAPDGGTAAVVNGERISSQSVESATRTIAGLLGASPEQVAQGRVVQMLVRGKLADVAAAKRGLTITDGMRDAAVSSAQDETLTALAASNAGRPIAYDLVDFNLVAQKLGEDGVRQALTGVQVEVNPRYGAWRSTDFGVNTDDMGSLSTLASPAPTASR